MSRMLDALKRIESRNAGDAERRNAGTDGRAVASPSSRPPNVKRAIDDAPRDEAAMEALLKATEAAAIEAAGSLPSEASVLEAAFRQPAALAASIARDNGPLVGRSRPPSDPLGTLADAMLKSMPPGNTGSFLFTSPDSDTLGIDLLAPLSMSLARRLRSSMLLIDANLRRPALAARLGVESSRGLTDVLNGAATWRDVVRRTVTPGVDVLPAVPFSTPAGPPPSRISLRRLLDEARGEYGLILVHAASLRFPEVVSIARDCEGAYLVVRLRATSRRTLRKADRILRQAGANVLGCVAVR